MANTAFKKSLILVVLMFVFSFSSFAQKKGKSKEFTKEFPVFIAELQTFMEVSGNAELKSTYKAFNNASGSFTLNEQSIIIGIANKMLEKKLKPKPHFNDFIKSVLVVSKHINAELLFLEWLVVIDETVENATTKNFIMFCDFTTSLIQENILHSSKSAVWTVNTSDYHFSFEDTEPNVIFSSKINLGCSNDRGEINIFDTKGVYYPLSYKWIGGEGLIYWENHGFSKDSVFAQTSNYKFDTRKSQVIADSSIFYNKNLFDEAIVGQIVNKIASGKQAENFPRFTSYSKDIEVKEIFDNVDYKGGYKLIGKKFVADGGDYQKARIIIRKEGKEVLIVNANRFNFGSDKITSAEVGVKIFFDTDSLFHSNLSFKYFDSKRQLQFYRDRNSPSGSPMLNSYHNLTMDFELLEWNIDSDIITFGSLQETAESIVRFESIDMYLQSRFEEIQGIDAKHPLLLIKKYIKEKKQEKFYLKDFARFARFPAHQAKPYLISLASYGFIFYDFAEERVTVQPMLHTYVNAASEIGDYDVISFHSKAKNTDKGAILNNHLVNAIINISSKDLIITGIYNVKLSDSSEVAILPDRGVITVKKNRDFLFNGQISAGGGRLNLFGKDFYFHYDEFKIDLESIDSLQLSIPWKNALGEEQLVRVNTLFEYVQDEIKPHGELRIDYSTNKSGLRKDSFPEFPIFKSNQRSYAYYDNSYSVYNRDRFFFHLDSYEIDSLDSFKAKGLFFAGTFESAGIFPTFKDTLRVQDDISFGFKRKTPIEGFPVYAGAGRFHDNIYLSNKGLKGDGVLEYKNAKAFASEISWFPDSANLHTNTFAISEVISGIEFPEVSNTETYAHFLPYKDKMEIYMKEEAFKFYKDQATFQGDLLMKPTGLTGDGIMTLDKAEVESEFFTYNANWFSSDAADLRVFAEEGEFAILGDNLRTHIDLKMRQGYFYANESESSFFNLISNNYMCYIDKCIWDMDAESFALGDTVSLNHPGSKFVSTHPNQESLSFFAKSAEYSLKDYIIHADGVESIVVADAVIHPDSGIVKIEKDAMMQTLLNATIDLTQSSSHVFTNATIDIQSSISYTASGEYALRYGMNNTKQIFFHKIVVNSENITQAYGDFDNKKPFSINNKLDIKGSVELYANIPYLTFNGYFRLNHSCKSLEKEWVKFRSPVDPENITIVLNNSLVNDNNDKLYAGIMMRKDTIGLYSTFFNKKKNVFDLEVINSTYSLSFDKEQSAFIVNGNDSLANTFTLFENTCKTSGEGEIDLNINLGKVKVKTIGLIQNDIKDKQTEIEGFVLIDFHFPKKSMEAMACDLAGQKQTKNGTPLYEDCDIEPIGYEDYDDLFVRNLKRVIKDQSYVDQIIGGLETSKRNSFPKELDYTLAFTKINLKWDNTNRAFVSTGDVGLGNINLYPIDEEEMVGLIVFEKKQGNSNDVLLIDLKSPAGERFFFKYKGGAMWSFSFNEQFKNSISENASDRRLDGKPRYNYSFIKKDNFTRESGKYQKNYERKY